MRNYLYTLKVAGWIAETNVFAPYYYDNVGVDPFSYAFKDKGTKRDASLDWKTKIAEQLNVDFPRPKRVLELEHFPG
jgi:hypothetical protein